MIEDPFHIFPQPLYSSRLERKLAGAVGKSSAVRQVGSGFASQCRLIIEMFDYNGVIES